MAEAMKKYQKRVKDAIKGFDCCRFTLCRKCPYMKTTGMSCKEKLYNEAAELLWDYQQNLLKHLSD